MGITKETLKFVERNIHAPGGMSMLELGCQELYPGRAVAKKYWDSIGFKCLSIDISGCLGSERVDLNHPVNLGQFDVVTNFGTSEHVVDVYNCFLNIHNACKVGGIMLHVVPVTGNWPGHGIHYFKKEFFKVLVNKSKYEGLEWMASAAENNVKDGWQMHCAIRKIGNKFIKRAAFMEYISDH